MPFLESEIAMLESTITTKGQTTLPKGVRDRLGVGPGDKVRYLMVGDEVRILRPIGVSTLRGRLRHDGGPVSLDDMDTAIGDGALEAGLAGDPTR